MAWVYVPESSAPTSHSAMTCDSSATSKSTPSAGRSPAPASPTGFYQRPLFGTTSEHSTGSPGVDAWISSLQASPARTSALQESRRAWTASARAFSSRRCALSKKLGRRSFSLRTSAEYASTSAALHPRWPKFGMTRGGVLYPLRKWERGTGVTGGSSLLPALTASDAASGGRNSHGTPKITTMVTKGLLPTLTVKGNYNRAGLSARSGDGLIVALKKLPTLTAHDRKAPRSKTERVDQKAGYSIGLVTVLGGLLSPMFCEWFMGFPLNWTYIDENVFGMRVGVSEKTLQERTRRQRALREAEVLQSQVHGPCDDEAKPETASVEPARPTEHGIVMRALRDLRKPPNTPSGSELAKQRRLEFDDALRLVSYVLASRTRAPVAEVRAEAMRSLREAIMQIGSMRHTSNAIQETWQSISEARQDWVVMAACFGQWWAEVPGVARTVTMSERLDRRLRAERVKALGNAMVPAQAREAWLRLSGLKR